MGMSHENCTHPRTPAGRAACRKAGGPTATPTPPQLGIPYDSPEAQVNRAEKQLRDATLAAQMSKPRKAPRQRSVTPADEAAYIEARRDAITAVQNDTPAKRGRRVPVTTDDRTTKQRMDSLWGGTTRRSYIRAEHDMADVPHVFSNVIRFAWTQGWEVWRGDPYNDTERRLVIATTYGTASLVWKSANPNGINGQFWRPVHTSITSRVPTVNRLLEIMKEMS